jgi:hypothetical protein
MAMNTFTALSVNLAPKRMSSIKERTLGHCKLLVHLLTHANDFVSLHT